MYRGRTTLSKFLIQQLSGIPGASDLGAGVVRSADPVVRHDEVRLREDVSAQGRRADGVEPAADRARERGSILVARHAPEEDTRAIRHVITLHA